MMGRTVQRIERITDVLSRLGILSPEEDKEIRLKIQQLKAHNKMRNS